MTECDSEPGYQQGYPVDRRRRNAPRIDGPVGDFEWKAGRVVARHLGECVVLQDDGSQGSMVDIRIEYRDREPGYVEVVTDIDPDYAAMQDWLKKLGKTAKGYVVPPTLKMARLQRAWDVTVSPQAYRHRRDLMRELESLLMRLESDGKSFQHVARIGTVLSRGHQALDRLTDLGAVMLASAPAVNGSASLLPDGIIGPENESFEAFAGWVSRRLAELVDVRQKLSATRSPERHIFVGTTFTSPPHVYFARLAGDRLPEPVLPAEITHVWVWNVEAGETVLAWFPDRGWFAPSAEWATV